MENESNKRKIYFIDKQFQTKFIIKFCLVVISGGLLTIGLVYLFSSRATTVSIVNGNVVVRRTADFLLPVLLQTVAIVVALTALATIGVTLFVSHRIAGPMYRFRKVLENVEKGDFSHGFKLRTHDQLKELADSLNQMIRVNRLQVATMKEFAGIAKRSLDRIEERDLTSNKAHHLKEARDAIDELKAVADKYKT